MVHRPLRYVGCRNDGNLLHGSRNQRPLYEGTPDSLKAYTVPGWFADARFGFWFHWGLQSAVGDGDWYARFMYIEGSPSMSIISSASVRSRKLLQELDSVVRGRSMGSGLLMDLYGKAEARSGARLKICSGEERMDKEGVAAVIRQLHLSRFRNRRG